MKNKEKSVKNRKIAESAQCEQIGYRFTQGMSHVNLKQFGLTVSEKKANVDVGWTDRHRHSVYDKLHLTFGQWS